MSHLSKKERILTVSIDTFREKGKKTTISEIGKKAGVTDSIIYHYFKNKEDLLFHAVGKQLEELIGILLGHLAPFSDPVDLLREFIWLQLHYHDKNPDYTNLTIFECRSKEGFFHHEAFDAIRQWIKLMRDILKKGIQSGVFRDDFSIPVMCDAIFGLLDMESIHSLAAQETKEAHPDIADIMSLLLPMIVRKEVQADEESDKALRILASAERIFAEKGYDNTTTLDISRMAGVAEGTLYEYYKNKEDLLYSTLGDRLSSNARVFKEISGRQSPLRRLKQMIQHHFFMYLSHPEFMKIFIFEGIFNKRFYRSTAKKNYNAYIKALYPVLDKGKKEGSIRPEVNNRVFKNLLMGLVGHMTLRWYFRKDDPSIDKFSEINEAVTLLTRAVAPEE